MLIHRIAYVDGKFNPTDVLTKLVTAAIQKTHIKRFFLKYGGHFGRRVRGIKIFPALR